MARMNWDRAAGRDRVARFGGDRVEPDSHGRNKPPRNKSKSGKKRSESERPGPSNVCSADGGKCDWSPWARQSLGVKRRVCKKCGVVSYRNTNPSGSACPKGPDGHEWSEWQLAGSGVSKRVCLRCGRVNRQGKGRRAGTDRRVRDTKASKVGSKNENRQVSRQACDVHDWGAWYGPQFGSYERRRCGKCGAQQSRKKR